MCESGCDYFETPKRSILGEVTNSPNYVSPTANLKLLTNVAHAVQNSYQRKEKSLKILCDKFLQLYPLYGSQGGRELQLDSTARQLGVEKRRIYDIINILEALQCATHCRKNTYAWHGASHLPQLLEGLRRGRAQGQGQGRPSTRDKSLGIMAQRFLMMFLVKPPNTLINLEMAIKALITPARRNPGNTPDSGKSNPLHKSQVRRLYDISNVLSSIGLIEKVSGNTFLKKPIFKYIGLKSGTLSKWDMNSPLPSSVLTPVSLVRPNNGSCSSAVHSKRKLVFSSPSPSRPSCYSSPPPTPTPHSRWDNILQVANFEYHRMKSGE